MAPSSTLVSSPGRRHHLSPVTKGPFYSNVPSNSARRTTPTKRPLFNDENADPNLSKRVKSVLAPSKSIPSINEILKPSSKPTITTNQPSKSRFILTDKPVAGSQPKRALSNITNTHQRVSKPSHRSAKPLVGSSLKKAYIPSPTRRTRAVSPPKIGSSRGQLKRGRSSTPPVVFRDVPTSSSNDVPAAPSIQQQQSIPDSWIFDIYEETEDETSQNLMEFSTHTLDISDISDNEETSGELDLGKENIPPSRLAQILSTPRESQMSVDAPVKCIPQRRAPGIGPGGRVLREHREPLREMKEEELLQPEKKITRDGDMIKKVMKKNKEGMPSDKITTTTKLPTLSKDSFITFTTPEKKKKPLLRATPSPGWKIWESDHDDDDHDNANDDNENLPPLPPPTKDELEIPLLASTCRKRALEE
ncbi:hypothetical protein L873DRAFT_1786843 [Choiromyces venosus 120613-1]|uniref:Uncharacterized protein n=1 Tax=Choiromyces venosus 120613-1 TaxID=1336337 RepID=A0A3N4JZV1_9PEZI|nr:hypothetical protein L873DRAFT_1786843 [Choiromyces venosus 120613-1]